MYIIAVLQVLVNNHRNDSGVFDYSDVAVVGPISNILLYMYKLWLYPFDLGIHNTDLKKKRYTIIGAQCYLN